MKNRYNLKYKITNFTNFKLLSLSVDDTNKMPLDKVANIFKTYDLLSIDGGVTHKDDNDFFYKFDKNIPDYIIEQIILRETDTYYEN